MRLISFAIVLFFTLNIFRVDAQVQEQRYVQSLPLSSISTGANITVKDPVDVNRYAEKSYKVLVKLVYGREARTDVNGKTFSYGINYSLAYLNQLGQVNATTQNGDALQLNYSGTAASSTEAYQALPVPADAGNWCGTTLTVTAVPLNTTPPSDLRVEVHLICTYRLAPNLLLFQGALTYNGAAKDFVWQYQRGASAYQLEWVYIDNECVFSPLPATAADYFLLKEPVRVMVKEQYFHFEPKYAAGKVYARIRAVWQYGGDANNQPHFCDWQYLASPTQINIVNTAPGVNEIQSFEATKNWQYATTYAEGGKSAQSVNFMDGSQRSRQNIALMNSENIELVSETLYDYEGRPVINVMPYPVAATSMNYRFRDNVFQGEGTTPNKSIYDKPYSASASIAMDSVSGAANYYSSSNTIINARNTTNAAYIPRARGYAYSQVQYMQDGTGRPMRQNTPGEAFVLDARGGNYTSYYYDQAKPMELQRLFGKNVGNALHYEKNYEVDNNGQISVTYKDQFGKVVATALAGEAPKKSGVEILSPILDNSGAPITVALNAQNTWDAAAGSLTSVNSQMNMKNPTSYTLHYDLKGVIDAAAAAFPTCNACSYNLEILITDPEGIKFSKSNFKNLTAASLNCGAPNFAITPAFDTLVTFTKIGIYKITKKLTLNKESMDVLTATIAASPLAPNLATIKASYRAAADYSSCDLTCRDRALTANPTWDPSSPSYVANPNNETYITNWIKLNNCENVNAIIDGTPDNSCANLLQLMTDELTSLGLATVGQHPEYCHYTACVRETASRNYDLKMAAAGSWSAALAAGYHNPLNMTHASIPSGGTVIVDPLLTSSVFSSGTFLTNLNEIKTSAVNSCLTNYLRSGQTVWQYAVDPASYPQGGTTGFNALSAADQDAYKWRVFSGAYQGFKQQVIYQMKTTAGNAWSCPYRDPEYAIVQDPYLVNNVAAIQAKSDGLQTASCGSLCEQNATNWLNALIDGGCVSLTNTEKITVITSLENYCLANCGSANPWGLLIAEHITEVRAGQNINAKPGYQYLQNTLQILDAKASCDLLNTSYINPYTYGASTAAQGMIPTTFAYELISATNKLLAEARTKTNLITSCPDNTSNLFVNNAYSINFGSAGYYYQYNTLMPDPISANVSPFQPSFAPRFVSFVNDEALKVFSLIPRPNANALKQYEFIAFEHDGIYHSAFPVSYPCYSGTCDYASNGSGKQPTVMEAPYYFVSYTGSTYSKIPKNSIYSISSNPRHKYMPGYSYLILDGVTNYTTYQFLEMDAVLIDGNGKQYSSIIYLPDFSAAQVDGFNIPFVACNQAGSMFYYAVPAFKPNNVSAVTPVTGITACSTSVQSLTGPKTMCNTKVTVSLKTLRDNCRTEQLAAADALAQQKYEEALATFTTNFLTTHVATCFSTNLVETFTLQYTNREYQYTLYYYDQAGNLVATVPPEGVIPLLETSFTNGVLNTGAANPVHKLQTYYRYNSIGKLITQESLDAGVSKFFYDSKSQLRLTQNAKQLATSAGTVNKYSYSKIDRLGRQIESGEVQNLSQQVNYFTDAGTRKDALALLDNPAFPNSNTYKDVTKTTYDAGVGQNLRSRVAVSITLKDGSTADNRTSYSYDIHGNVKRIIQEPILNQPKIIDYCYDLISGVIKQLDYQKGFADQYWVKYNYDANNRLRNASSSFDNGLSWKEDAEYFYYLHGSLARTEYGQSKVQGMDYAYTLQGWIKMGNTPHERTQLSGLKYKNTKDIGNDGMGTGVNQYVAQDEFAYALGYYNKDYSAIGAAVATPLGLATDAATRMSVGIAGSGLYNANIIWQITQLNRLAEMQGSVNENFGIRAAGYKYDQLNRLKQAGNYVLSSDVPAATPSAVLAPTANSGWNCMYDYDRNGNITNSVVYGKTTAMDMFSYNYTRDPITARLTTNNRLNSVTDIASAYDGTYVTDINSGQGASNYTYDAIGNLTGDAVDGSTIEWTANGKVRKVTKPGVVLEYKYDAAGNRVSKKASYSPSGATTLTSYVRDASGNVIATYIDNSLAPVMDIEYNLYGSQRIGRVLASSIPRSAVAIPQPDSKVYLYKPGVYQYELSNHLGNIQAVVTGLKIGENTDGNALNAELYRSSVVSLSDYYPFGMEIEGRTYINVNAYRYGFNGKEKDSDIATGDLDFGARIYDSRIGRWLSLDPSANKYSGWSPYNYVFNNPLIFIDPDGKDPIDPRTGKKYKILLAWAFVCNIDNTKPTFKKVTDKDLLRDASFNNDWWPNFYGFDDKDYNGDEDVGMKGYVATRISPGAELELALICGEWTGLSQAGTKSSLTDFQTAAVAGSYTFADDVMSESVWFNLNKASFNVISVEENYITRIVNLTRDASDDNNKYSINSVTTFSIIKGPIQTEQVNGVWVDKITKKYKILMVTETTQKYVNNKPSGDPTTKTYAVRENVN